MDQEVMHDITLVLAGAAFGFVLLYVMYLIYLTIRLTFQEPDHQDNMGPYSRNGGLDD